MTKEQFEEFEKYDKYKTKILKYVLYKKRTEYEIKQKFYNEVDENMLTDIIEELKSNMYIDDKNYIDRAINEFMALNKLSIKEIKYKLISKGIKSNLMDEYISDNYDEIKDFEIKSAIKIANRKLQSMTPEEVKVFLMKKGYSSESIREALNGGE